MIEQRVFSHYFKPLVVSTFARIYQDISGDFTQITSIKSAKFRPGADTSASSYHGADTSHLQMDGEFRSSEQEQLALVRTLQSCEDYLFL